MTKRKISIGALMLCTTLWGTALNAEPEADKVTENLELTQRESTLEIASKQYAVTTTFRGGVKILEKVTPPDQPKNSTVYYVYLNDFKVLTYTIGQGGSEFSGVGMGREQITPKYTITVGGDKEGRIEWITLYSSDFTKAFDRFGLKNGELIPWSGDKLAKYRKMRSEAPDSGQ